ncbi:hypothetical protein I350_00529 [Cryptococcus amylolentus CBS 6273]|uniref:Uncharacterized protein n=1 Tax=Cryptococcus amylolentus CBS 6273 TaxID=1296118 RepID=A0A1E3KFF3_9TREE|nr:hypothetical protein I350_00529 [Cryptococcus amylolentus CBS 6273]
MSFTQRLSRPLPVSARLADDDDGIVKAMRPVRVTQKQLDRVNLSTDALVKEAQEAKTSNSVEQSSAREDLDSDEEEDDDDEDRDTRSEGRQEGTEDGDEQDDDEQDGQESNQGQLDRLGRDGEGNDGDDDEPHSVRRAYKARQDDRREKNGLDPKEMNFPGFSRVHRRPSQMNQFEDKHQVSCYVFIASAHRQDERVQEIVRSQVAAAFLRAQKSVRPFPFLGEFASILEGNKMARGDWASGAPLETMPSNSNVETRRVHIQKTLAKQCNQRYTGFSTQCLRKGLPSSISWTCLEKHGVEVVTGSVGVDLLRGFDSGGKRIKVSKEQCRAVWDEMDKGLNKLKMKDAAIREN